MPPSHASVCAHIPPSLSTPLGFPLTSNPSITLSASPPRRRLPPIVGPCWRWSSSQVRQSSTYPCPSSCWRRGAHQAGGDQLRLDGVHQRRGVNGLHSYGVLLTSGHPKRFTLYNIHPFMHTFTHRRRRQPCKATPSSSGAVRMRCLAQGYYDLGEGYDSVPWA